MVHTDPRISEAVRYGFEREGADVVAAQADHFGDVLANAAPDVVVAGGNGAGEGRAVLDRIRDGLGSAEVEVPVLYLGNGIGRAQAIEAGASEFMEPPAFLRDVVTMGRLLASPRKGGVISGELHDYVGLFYVVRALAAVSRTGVLTMVRGLRRGELRFYEGEVTSAQVGSLHGLAALHQLLLWSDARFELRDEQVVRRRQIPLDPPEVLEDAERFLAEIRNASGGLSPALVLEQVPEKVQASKLPAPVGTVLGMFDGHRTVADVIEDSPYRAVETLRIGSRLSETGLVRAIAGAQPAGARTALAIEEWMIGSPGGGVPSTIVTRESEPIGPAPGEPASPPKSKKKRKKKKRKKKAARETAAPAPAEAATPVETDWSALLPESIPQSDAGISPVVPSTMTSGEIDISAFARRDQDEAGAKPASIEVSMPDEEPVDGVVRERLEEVANTEQRAQIFPAEQVPEAAGARDQVASEVEAAAASARAAEEAALREARAVARSLSADEAATAEEPAAAEAAEAAPAEEPEAAEAAPAEEPVAAEAAPAEEPVAAEAAPAEEPAAAEAAEAAPAEEPVAAEAAPAEEPVAAEAAPAEEPAAEEAAPAEEPAAEEPEEAAPAEGPAAEEAAEAAPAEEPEAAEAAEAAPAEASGVVEAVSGSTSGEIAVAEPRASSQTDADAPSVVVEDAAEPSVVVEDAAEPSALVSTVASDAAGVAAGASAAGPSSAGHDLATDQGAAGAEASSLADQASHFTDEEEAFFSAGKEIEKAKPKPIESFEDLDHGYSERTFWQRLFSKKK